MADTLHLKPQGMGALGKTAASQKAAVNAPAPLGAPNIGSTADRLRDYDEADDWLDAQSIPRKADGGEVLSLLGRIYRLDLHRTMQLVEAHATREGAYPDEPLIRMGDRDMTAAQAEATAIVMDFVGLDTTDIRAGIANVRKRADIYARIRRDAERKVALEQASLE